MRFTFGENWLAYSRRLDESRVREATASVEQLVGGSLEGRSFVDVGAGSGLFSIAAVRLGAAHVVALDRDPGCVDAIQSNLDRFLDENRRSRVEVRHADVLAADSLPRERFDVVYAWGSLHHTGAMWRAIENTAELCSDTGLYVLAIYNQTRWSRQWHAVKRLYNISPAPVRVGLVSAMTGARGAVRAMRGRAPFRSERGMSVWYDSVDWLGGLPYEYAPPYEVESRLALLGFRTVRRHVTTRLGCNEFVVRRS